MNIADITVDAGIATVVATLASIVLTSLWRLADRERVEWAPFSRFGQWHRLTAEAGPGVFAMIANVGRANAQDVRLKGIGCVVLLTWLDERGDGGAVEMAPLVRPGGHVMVNAQCNAADWNRAAVVITWAATPRLFRKRQYEVLPISDLATEPPPPPTGLDAEELGLPPDAKVVPEPEPPRLPGPVRSRLPRRWDLLGRLRMRRAVLSD